MYILSIFRIPCSQVLVVCWHRGWDLNSFVTLFYLASNYKWIYEAKLYSIANEKLWNEVSFVLHYYKSNMKSGGPGRLWSKRYRGSTLVSSTQIPSLEMKYYNTIPHSTIKWHISKFNTTFFSVHLYKVAPRFSFIISSIINNKIIH